MSGAPMLGSWARRVDGALVAEPRDERELIEMVHVLADRKVSLHRELALSRARLNAVGQVHAASMTLTAGAGVALWELDAHLQGYGLTLGPLSPAAMALRLGEFLEGPYAGLHPIAGGRLEPLCTSLVAITADGRRLETSLAPRSAAGPELSALVLGAQGRIALVTQATVRCTPAAVRDVRATFRFPSAGAFVAAMHRALAEGFVPWRVLAVPSEGVVMAQARWAATLGGVERDRELLARCVTAVHGRSAEVLGDEPPTGAEREVAWADVSRALELGTPLTLFRCSLGSVIARGALDAGVALDVPGPWSPDALRLLALDERKTFGGAP